MFIKLGWWNTSLSPTKGRKPTIKDRQLAVRIIGELLADGVDLLGLCEVSIDEVKEYEGEFGGHGFGVAYALDNVGKTRFDMALIYRMSKVRCFDTHPWSVLFGNNTFRSGYYFDLIVGDDRIALIACHWPGRRFYPAQSKNRTRVAADVRSKIDNIIGNGIHDVIVMGDFNDEPFNDNIFHVLRAIRDRSSASAHRDLLYNPFWNFLGSRPLYEGENVKSLCGTHYYKLDHTECWWTFDQILFSSSFLGSGNWFLNENMTTLHDDKELMGRMRARKRFDHLPVISGIQKVG